LAFQDAFLLSAVFVSVTLKVQLNHNRSLIYLEDGGSKSLWNISTFLPVISLVTSV